MMVHLGLYLTIACAESNLAIDKLHHEIGPVKG